MTYARPARMPEVMNILKLTKLRLLQALLLAISLSAGAQVNIGEDTLKALYSYKFALFNEWPKTKVSNNNALEFCVIGRNPFGQAALEAVEGKPVKDKAVHVEVFANGLLSEESLGNCHVLFISNSEIHRLPAILDSLHQLPILTISDIQGFSKHGGMITLIQSGDRLQFEINPDAIQQAGMAMSSKIIELGAVVKTAKPGRSG